MQLILHDVSNKNVLALECKYPDQIVIIKLSKKLKLKYIRSYLVEAHIHPLFYVVPLQGLHFFFGKQIYIFLHLIVTNIQIKLTIFFISSDVIKMI